MEDNSKPLVSIRCLVYNHEPYLRQCLDGFVMQKTDFPFEAIVHDDASTDNSAAIIREYAEKYPDIIKPIYETENQYSKKDGSLSRIMNEAIHPKAKYVALCEGDDYWTDPLKLQRQANFMELNSDYSMCWTDAYVETNGTQKVYNRYKENCQSPIEDIIIGGGDFIPTCSLFLRKNIIINLPDKAKGYFCGDYPLQIWCAYIGKTYYFKKPTCVYRFMAEGSWSYAFSKETKAQRFKHYENEKKLMAGCNELLEYKYDEIFKRREADVLYSLLISAEKYSLAKPYLILRRKYNKHIDKVEMCKIYGYPNLARLVALLSKIKRFFLNVYNSCRSIK